jgi:hypothetical protein
MRGLSDPAGGENKLRGIQILCAPTICCLDPEMSHVNSATSALILVVVEPQGTITVPLASSH